MNVEKSNFQNFDRPKGEFFKNCSQSGNFFKNLGQKFCEICDSTSFLPAGRLVWFFFAVKKNKVIYEKIKVQIAVNTKSIFPLFESISKHNSTKWRCDIVAGLTVAVMIIPQGMAYAMLAGVPPIYGLYAGLIPLILYALLGTSRQLAIGPVAISSILVWSGVSQIAEPFTAEYISLVVLAGLLIGLAQMLLGLLRFGFLSNFISHPVIVGFTSAASIIIAISQLKDFLGIEIPRFPNAYETLQYAILHIGETNWQSALVCASSIILMLILKKINRSIPHALIVVLLGIVLVYGVGEERLNLPIAGDIPQGLPSLVVPVLTWENIVRLLPTVFTVTIIGIVESISIARLLQAKHDNYRIRPDQELIALGLSKIGGAFFQAIPTSSSFSRSAVNNSTGAHSGISSIITALLVGLTLLFLTPVFYFLPKAVLAAIILLSVLSLFDWREAIHLWRTHRIEFYMMLGTFLVTLIFGIEEGVFAGVALSIFIILVQSSRPHIAVLGKLPNTNTYRNINRFELAEQIENTLIVRFDHQLYFANAGYFQEMIQELMENNQEPIHLLILDASCINSIDSSGIKALKDLHRFCKEQNIQFYTAGMVGPVRDKATKTGLIRQLGKKSLFLNTHQAIMHHKNQNEDLGSNWNPDAIQSQFRKTQEDSAN